MKKMLFIIFVLALVVVGGAAVTFAQDGATVINDVGCGIAAADSGLPIGLSTTESHSVVTPDGNTTLTCHFDVPEGLYDGPAMQHSGFSCSTFAGVTTNSRSTTNKNRVVLTCQINGSN